MSTLFKRTMMRIFQRPFTRAYPFTTRAPFADARGHITMDPDACIYCGICQKRCPSNAIVVSRKPNPNRWTFDPHACIVCGDCVTACPKRCITMQTAHRKPE